MKHIHFIGICGVGMSALAILWKKKGWHVTGSDSGFFPPISTHLEKNKIEFYPGWHPEKMGTPDLVVVGNVASSNNPEWVFVQKHNIRYMSYPELIAHDLVRKNSIVCAGTWGKTSTTALLSHILKLANFQPSYMFGGLALNLKYSADDEGGNWSILEGDEYKTGKHNPEAKFFSYKPTHLLLTGLEWDHFDMYPTEKSYYDAFTKLLNIVPSNGLIITCSDNKNSQKLLQQYLDDTSANKEVKIINYGKIKSNYTYSDISSDKDGIHFVISNNKNGYKIYSPMIGEYMAENICGAFAMAHSIGIETDIIINAIKTFNGIKRRLEKRITTLNGVTIFDDIAHSPAKAKSVLATLRKIYNGKIIAIFEPNTGNRQSASISGYENAFSDADEVIIPRLTRIKKDINTTEVVMDGKQLAGTISKTHTAVKYIEDDEKLVEYIKTATTNKDVIVFLGSHGFRGMIENIISQK